MPLEYAGAPLFYHSVKGKWTRNHPHVRIQLNDTTSLGIVVSTHLKVITTVLLHARRATFPQGCGTLCREAET